MASELAYGGPVASRSGGGRPLTQLDVGGEVIPVRQGIVAGSVDQLFETLAIAPPSDASWSDYRWLEIDAAGPGLTTDRFAVSDTPAVAAHREVTFRTLGDRPRALRVYIGSCAQWHGYANGPLYISHEQAQRITSVRLLP
jgi:hypothetical protein